MNKYLIRLIIFLSFSKIFTLPLYSSDVFEFHKKCLKAKDYKGCIDSNKKIFNSETNGGFNRNEDYCEKNQDPINNFCIAGKGNDLLGEAKINGWLYKEFPEFQANFYVNPNLKQLEVDNEFRRYLETTFIIRSFREYIPDRAPQQVTIGDSKTKCWQSGFGSTYFFGDSSRGTTNYSGSINCKTESPETTFIGGQKGQAEGVNTSIQLAIFDCDTGEFATKYINKEDSQLSEWEPLGGIFKALVDEGCRNYLLKSKSNRNEFSDKTLR